MTIVQKFGLILTVISGLGLAYFLTLVAHTLITDQNVAWGVVASAFVAGITFIFGGLKDSRTHQKDTRQESDEVNNTPENERTD